MRRLRSGVAALCAMALAACSEASRGGPGDAGLPPVGDDAGLPVPGGGQGGSDAGGPPGIDAGAPPDAGGGSPQDDAGVPDAGPPGDAGAPQDGGGGAPQPDAGAPDGGAAADAGAPGDGGTAIDAGPTSDGGSPPDAGTDGGVTSFCPPLLNFGVPFDPAHGGIASSETCTDGGWCSENSPMGSLLLATWAGPAGEVWMVGEAGAAVQWDGASWTAHRVPTAATLGAVWASAAQDVWAGGDGGLVAHWDGARWTQYRLGTPSAIVALSGSAPDDVWAGADAPAGEVGLFHWDGASWTAAASDGARSLFSLSRSAVLRAGRSGCFRWDGAGWTPLDCGVADPTAVWASSLSDIWVAGRATCHGPPPCPTEPDRAHWDGAAWTRESLENASFRSLVGTAADDVWLDGNLHWDGRAWTPMCGPGGPFGGMPATGQRGSLWIPSSLGDIEHFDGSSWVIVAHTLARPLSRLRGASGDVWAIAASSTNEGNAVLRFDGATLSSTAAPTVQLEPADPSGGRVFGSSSRDAWFVGLDRQLWHWDGAAAQSSLTTPVPMRAGFSRSATNAIVTQPGAAWHWDGQSWAPIAFAFLGDTIVDFAGTAPDDVWAVGSRPTNDSFGPHAVAWHWDGAAWNQAYLNAVERGELRGVVAVARGQVFALDDDPVANVRSWRVLRWNGTTFESSLEDPSQRFTSLGGTGPDDVWAAAVGVPDSWISSLFHFDGARWTQAPALGLPVFSLWGVPGVETVALTEGGGLFVRRR